MRILWQSSTAIHGFPAYAEAIRAHGAAVLTPGTELVLRGVRQGTSLLHYRAFDFLNNAQLFDSVIMAEREGCEAVAIGCFLDPILDELREVVDIPVLSLAETGMHLACMLGKRFSVMSYTGALNDKFYGELVHKYGLAERAAPMVSFELPFEELEVAMAGRPQACLERVREAGRRAVAQGAEVILLGCGLLNLIAIRNGLVSVEGATILDVSGALMKLAETMAVLRRVSGLSVSRRGLYQKPDAKDLDKVLRLYRRGPFAGSEAD